ncbi:MAG: hypothetical protein K0U39_09555 [Alphaproteobacteria bacterium]|nr:hypothetical protein [Alphaproteobacteria bacterium]
MKNMMKLFAICITIGIVLSSNVKISYAQFNKRQTQTEFSYTAVSYQNLTYDDPENANYFADELNGSLWQYKQTINKNNKVMVSYLNVASPEKQYDTGRYWQVNNQPAIYQGTRQHDAGALGFQHFLPLNYDNTVKLYLAPAIINSNYILTIEYLNNSVLPPTETKGSATDIEFDVGFAFYPVETIEIIISSDYTSAISDTDIEKDEDLESGYEGYHVNLAYNIKRNTKISLGAYHDDEDINASYTSLSYNGTITPSFGLNFEYVKYGDDRYSIVFGPIISF